MSNAKVTLHVTAEAETFEAAVAAIFARGFEVLAAMPVTKPEAEATPAPKAAPAAKKAAVKKSAKPAAPEQTTDAAEGNDWGDAPDNAAVEGEDIVVEEEAPAPVPTKLTLEDVRKHLDAFAKKHGLVTARTLMAEIAGGSKLVDIKPEKYASLIAALDKHANG